MKFPAFATLLPLLFSSSIFAAATHDVIRGRQAHVKKDLIDVCVALDVDVQVAPNGIDILLGHLNLCLCLSVLPGFLGSNPIAGAVVNHLGTDGARNYFTNLIQGQGNKQQCHYPPHAAPFCSLQCPCDFTCGNGYTPFPPSNPTQCVCNPPNSECNGVCGNFPHGCSSQTVSRSRRNQATCSALGRTLCGIPGRSGLDCVDTKTNKESCGGCTVAHGNSGANGKNCKDIPHVKDVECNGGACKVISCKDNFKPSPALDACVEAQPNHVRKARSADAADNGAFVDHVFDLIIAHNLFVPTFNLIVGKAQVLNDVDIFNYPNVLQDLLLQDAIIGVPHLADLMDVLGVGLTVLRRDGPNTDYVLGLLLDKRWIVGYNDLSILRGYLGAVVLAYDVDHLLGFLLEQGLVVVVNDVAALRERLGLGVDVL